MEVGRKNELAKIYAEIDRLETKLYAPVFLGSRSESDEIKKNLLKLRGKVTVLLGSRTHAASASETKDRRTSSRDVLKSRSSGIPKKVSPPRSTSSVGSSRPEVSRTLARDAVYRRLDELGHVLLSNGIGEDQKKRAREERAMLEDRLKTLHTKSRGRTTSDHVLVGLVKKYMQTHKAAPQPRASVNPKKVEQFKESSRTREGSLHEDRRNVSASGGLPIQKPHLDSYPDEARESNRLSYLDSCTTMGFKELLSFVRESLQRVLKEGGTSGRERPQTKDEFFVLYKLLQGKIEESEGHKDVLHAPVPPTKFRPFTESEQLLHMLEQRDYLSTQLNHSLENPSATSRSIRKLKRKLRNLEENLVPLQEREHQAYALERDEYYRPHEEARLVYEEAARKLHKERILERERLRTWRTVRMNTLQSIRNDINRAFPQDSSGFGIPVKRLSWSPLPPGELSVARVHSHYEQLQRQYPEIRYERERITKAFSLGPDCCYVGKNSFDRYVVFTFAHTSKVLLECPIFGNAMYVLDGDWKRLARMSKGELLSRNSREVTRVIHKKNWFSRVKMELRIR